MTPEEIHALDSYDVFTAEAPAPFVVDDEAKANFVVKKIVQSREYVQRVKRWAAKEIRRSEQDEERLLFLFGRQLEIWASSRLDGRRKSINLPGGRIGFRRKPMKLVVVDEEAVKAWARENCPSAIKTVERLMKAAINEHFVATGEVPPTGIRVENERNAFYIK
jgi:hypothetical protein